MSIALMNLVWENSSQSGSTLLALLCLADHANDEGICWPSIPRIAKRARISERQAIRALGELQASGEVQVIERGGGKGNSNIYRVTPVSGFKSAGAAMDTVTPASGNSGQRVTPEAGKGDIRGPNGDIGSAKGDTAMSLESPIRNLHLESPGTAASRSQTHWVEILARLQKELPRANFDTWVRDSECVSETDGEIVVGVANAYSRDWLESRVRESAERAAAYILGKPTRVRFRILEERPARASR